MRMNSRRRASAGFAISMEVLLLTAILVLGLIAGLVSLRDSVLTETSDLSESIGAVNQGYNALGVNNAAGTASTAGSAWQDAMDFDGPIDVGGGDSSLEYAFGTTTTESATLPVQP